MSPQLQAFGVGMASAAQLLPRSEAPPAMQGSMTTALIVPVLTFGAPETAA